MKIVYDDIWKTCCDILLVTSNNSIKSNGELVMGRGAALEMKQRFPEFPKKAGALIKAFSKNSYYGVIIVHVDEQGRQYGLFQVKEHFKSNANIYLIKNSLSELSHYASCLWGSIGLTVALNFPGIGYGRLTEDTVLPFLHVLPNNVYIYKK